MRGQEVWSGSCLLRRLNEINRSRFPPGVQARSAGQGAIERRSRRSRRRRDQRGARFHPLRRSTPGLRAGRLPCQPQEGFSLLSGPLGSRVRKACAMGQSQVWHGSVALLVFGEIKKALSVQVRPVTGGAFTPAAQMLGRCGGVRRRNGPAPPGET